MDDFMIAVELGLLAILFLLVGIYFLATPAEKLPFWDVMRDYWFYRSGLAGKYFWVWGLLATMISAVILTMLVIAAIFPALFRST
jgi:hypothetical protein